AEEAGLEVKSIEKIYDCFMSPGSVTERLHFYIGEYEKREIAERGGVDGEDIEILEIPFAQALAMVKSGEIMDAKTIMLLQYLQLHVFRQD
ncbi:MAG: ADP-ribose pyrophosphatase, partial [Cyanobacteria bacterium PR.023]|nr:ADP-ribose pyrophosphatase [Cyanobacteria bacterium PR.023]